MKSRAEIESDVQFQTETIAFQIEETLESTPLRPMSVLSHAITAVEPSVGDMNGRPRYSQRIENLEHRLIQGMVRERLHELDKFPHPKLSPSSNTYPAFRAEHELAQILELACPDEKARQKVINDYVQTISDAMDEHPQLGPLPERLRLSR
jgi:hypothetical protein